MYMFKYRIDKKNFSFFLAVLALSSLLITSCSSTPTQSHQTSLVNTSKPTSTSRIYPTTKPSATTKPIIRGCVTVSSLRIRSGPGTEYQMLGGLIRDDCVTIIEATSDKKWGKINHEGIIGWVALEYMTINTTLSGIAVFSYPTKTPKPLPTWTSRPAPTAVSSNCHPSYPTVCIPYPPPDLDCGDIPYRRFQVIGSDPHRFDGDNDGIGCESN